MQFERSQRVETLQKCCAKYERTQFHERDVAKALRNVIVDRTNRFLYCYVPKVASTNMRRLILALQGKTDNPDAIGKFDRRGFEFLGDFNAPKRYEMIKTYFKFMFVRHPLERVVSAYRHRVMGTNRADLHRRYAVEIVKKYRDLKNSSKILRGDDVTFGEFVKHLLGTKNSNLDPHFKPFFDICHPCIIPYNFIGSMERLNLDVDALLEKLNFSKKISFPKRQGYYHPIATSEAMLYYKNISYSELQSLRNVKYKKDFECFNYARKQAIRTRRTIAQA